MKEHHPLFNYIRTLDEGKYISSSNRGSEYYLRLIDARRDFPQIFMSYNDVRAYWMPSENNIFEKDGESIGYYRPTGEVVYSRFKENVPSIINPSFNFPMDITEKYKKPYPKSLEQLLDGTLSLFRTAHKIKD